MNKVEVSVIIPMYNSQNTIIQVLEGLEIQTAKNFEVIVVDDGSMDRSSQLVADFAKQSNLAIYMARQENLGPATARNMGVRCAKGKVIIFLDADCIPTPNWVEAMSDVLKGNIVGCNCVCKTKNSRSLIARYVGYEVSKRHEQMVGKSIDALSTCMAAFRKDVFVKAGGFDTGYKAASGEDFALSFKIRQMGYDLIFTDKTYVFHYHPDSLKRYLRQQYIRGYWRVKMYRDNIGKIVKGDSYTGYEAQLQFGLSVFAFASILLAVFNPFWPLVGIGALLLSNLPLGLWAYRREKKFVVIAPVLASLRSLAGSVGVYAYLSKHIPNKLKECFG
jgi:glycosyltransferase involved in cell wall biosynthesis